MAPNDDENVKNGITQEISDQKMIQKEYELLLEEYKNSGHNTNIELVDKAFQFANKAHANVRRRSGEPYMMHPLAVARIVVNEIGLGTTSVCSALLHDVVEDTDYTVEDIQNLFGERIATIVDGLTKIAGGVFGEQASSQAENFRKLLFTISEDVRVIMIKIADRLHNMRTLSSMPPAKQYKIAGETLYMYAPLAHRLGFFKIKTELEDLSFKYEHPEIFAQLQKRVEEGNIQREELFQNFTSPIQEKLKNMGYEFIIQKRVKAISSIWHKMQTKNVPFEEVYDLMAVRIVYKPIEGLDEKDQAWMIYSTITGFYKPHPDRIRDWISTPKANGYEALHVTVMGNDGQWIEVQIRSERMNEIAEKGISAHWKYKQGGAKTETELDNWLKTIKELLENPDPSTFDFLDTFKLNLFSTEIFVFTPKGEIRTLPQNATALDFAFSLHSDIGMQCIGAKVNHKLVPLSHVLKSGDQIEILTSKKQIPQPEWLDYVTSARAKAKLRVVFRKEMRATIEKGREKLEDRIKELNYELDNSTIQQLMNYFKINKREDLFYEIGKDVISKDKIVSEIFKKQPSKTSKWKPSFKIPGLQTIQKLSPMNLFTTKNQKSGESKTIIDRKKVLKLDADSINNSIYTIANCCHPIPGDDVIAFLNEEGTKVTLHKRQCAVAEKLKANFGNRIVQTEWESKDSRSFPALIQVKGIDKQGVLSQIITVISNQYSVNIIKINLETNDGIFFGTVEVSVHSTEDINNLCLNLSKIKSIILVSRVENLN